MCQRHSGALTTSWAWFEKGAVRWTGSGGAPARYRSSPKWYRCFCPRCGSSLGAIGVDGVTALPLGAFDRLAGEALMPRRHFYRARHPRWWAAGVAKA
jgi:hypothetical protein